MSEVKDWIDGKIDLQTFIDSNGVNWIDKISRYASKRQRRLAALSADKRHAEISRSLAKLRALHMKKRGLIVPAECAESAIKLLESFDDCTFNVNRLPSELNGFVRMELEEISEPNNDEAKKATGQ